MKRILLFSMLLLATSFWCRAQVLVNEDFSAGSLPAGWSITSITNDVWFFGGGLDFGSTSTINDPDGNFGEYARIDFSNDPDTTALVVPAVSITGITSPQFSFYYISQTTSTAFSPYNRLVVDYWNGSNWINIEVIDTLTTQGWTKYTYNISGYTYSGDSVKFRLAAQEGGAAVGGTGTSTFDQDLAVDNVYIGIPCDVTVATSGTNISCNGLLDGAATAVAANGTGPYTYLWSNSATTASISAVGAGTYALTATDALGCPSSGSITLSEPAVLVASAAVDSQQTCFVGGGASVLAFGGTAPYSYLWSNSDTTASIDSLVGGTFSVTITDTNGCTAVDSASIMTYTDMQMFLSSLDPTCSGGDGWVVVDSVTGGQQLIYDCGDGSAFSCNGTPGSDTLGAGTATNGTTSYPAVYGNWYWGAKHQIMYRKSELNAMGIVGPTNLSSIAFDIATINGTANYSDFEIQMGCTPDSTMAAWQNMLTVVHPGNAIVIAAGWNTHTFSTPFFWNGEDNLVVQVCFNNSGFTNNSAVKYTPSSYTSVRYYRADIATVCSNTTSTTGTSANRPNTVFTHCAVSTPAYTYLWSNGSAGDTISSLDSGMYSLMVTDQFGCTIIDTVTLTPPSISAATVGTNVNCNGANDGSISATPSGGAAPYTYMWSNGNMTSTATSLAPGSYSVTVTDSTGCSVIAMDSITEPTALVLTVSIDSNESCTGYSNGALTASASGGTPNYNYTWNTLDNTASIANLTAGTYTAAATDANGCTAADSGSIITMNTLPIVDLGDDIETMNSQATITGPAGFSAYNWSNGDDTDSIVVTSNGDFSLIATDSNGCSGSDTINVSLWPLGISEASDVQNVLVYPNPGFGMFTVETPGWAKEQLEWSIYDLNGALVQSGNFGAQTNDVRGLIDLTGTAAGVYMLNLRAGEHDAFVRIVIQ